MMSSISIHATRFPIPSSCDRRCALKMRSIFVTKAQMLGKHLGGPIHETACAGIEAIERRGGGDWRGRGVVVGGSAAGLGLRGVPPRGTIPQQPFRTRCVCSTRRESVSIDRPIGKVSSCRRRG